jgi:hypothetical protein
MKPTLCRFFFLAMLALMTGCNLQPEPERLIREATAAMDDLTNTLQTVRDANTATAAINGLDKKFTRLTDVTVKMGKVAQANPNAVANQKSLDALSTASTRIKTEFERVNSLRGLPTEFWKIVTIRSLDMIAATLAAMPQQMNATTNEVMSQITQLQTLYQQHPFEEVVRLRLLGVMPDRHREICDLVAKLAPGATICNTSEGAELNIFIGPVKEINAFARTVALGMQSLDDPRRMIEIQFDASKLGPSPAEKMMQEAAERQAKHAREMAESQRQASEAFARSNREINDTFHALDRLDPSAPDYYDKLVDLLNSDNSFNRDKVIKILLNTSPSEVTAEQRKKIARVFKDMAEDDMIHDKKKVVRGLVIWGGKYSGPILLKILNTDHFGHDNVIEALGEIKYGPAASAIASKLGEHFVHETAVTALRALGEEAEDALIVTAASPDARICLASVDLLRECGTKKSLAILRRGFSSSNFQVREACREAMRTVTTRIRETEKAAKEKKDQEEDES